MRLAGRIVVTTRDEPGRLDELLVAAGAEVVHVPLIEIGDAPDGGVALDAALAGLSDPGDFGDGAWLVVTSKHGARRCGAAAAGAPHVRLAAVGAATASELAARAGRPVDLVPVRQTAADLLLAMPPSRGDGPRGGPSDGPGERVVLAQADRADGGLADGLADLGYAVDAVTAYSTRLRRPTPDERAMALAADAVAFASGSAAVAWSEAIGVATPPVVVAIGPSTAAVASQVSLKVTHVAADHSIEGLAAAIVEALRLGA